MVEENASQKLVTYEVPASDQEKEGAVISETLWTCHRFPIEWHTSRQSALSRYAQILRVSSNEVRITDLVLNVGIFVYFFKKNSILDTQEFKGVIHRGLHPFILS